MNFEKASNYEKLQQFSPIFGVFWAFSVNSLKIWWKIAWLKVNYGKISKNSIVFPETQLFSPKLRNFFKTQAKISSKLRNTKNLRVGRLSRSCKKSLYLFMLKIHSRENSKSHPKSGTVPVMNSTLHIDNLAYLCFRENSSISKVDNLNLLHITSRYHALPYLFTCCWTNLGYK